MSKIVKDPAEVSGKPQKSKKHRVSRKKGGGEKIIPIIEKIIAVVLVLTVVYFIGKPFVNNSGLIERSVTVAKVGGQKFKAPLFSYNYRDLYYRLFSQYAQYYSYGIDVGFDVKKVPSENPYKATEDELDQAPEAASWKTWADWMTNQTILNMRRTWALYAEAGLTEGTTDVTNVVDITNADPSVPSATSVENRTLPFAALSDEEKAEIDEQIQSIRDSNKEQNVTVNAALARNYGPGFTEKELRQQLAYDILTQRLVAGKLAEFKATYNDKKLTELYNEDLVDYGRLDYYTFVEKPALREQRKATEKVKAETDEEYAKYKTAELAKFKKSVEDTTKKLTDLKAFLAGAERVGKAAADDPKTYKFDPDTYLKARADGQGLNAITDKNDAEKAAVEHFHSDAATWGFNTARKVGDVKVFYGADDSANYVYILRTVYPFVPATVREIVIETVADSADTTAAELAIGQVATAKDAEKKAKDVLAIYNKGKKTAEAFGELAKGNSSGETATEGGVVLVSSSITRDAKYLAWALDPARKPGDTTTIAVGTSVYVLYYEKTEKAEYFDNIGTTKSQEDYEKWEKALLEKDEFKLKINETWAKFISKRIEKDLKKNVLPRYVSSLQEPSNGGLDLSSLLGGG
ncbi:MAG: hypothetical protein LBN05_08130 [Oscillospiraceae bacterium]|jgi:hypothetical protein|nr:hypothetical protein [Oscillospiraceae bacterium]